MSMPTAPYKHVYMHGHTCIEVSSPVGTRMDHWKLLHTVTHWLGCESMFLKAQCIAPLKTFQWFSTKWCLFCSRLSNLVYCCICIIFFVVQNIIDSVKYSTGTSPSLLLNTPRGFSANERTVLQLRIRGPHSSGLWVSSRSCPHNLKNGFESCIVSGNPGLSLPHHRVPPCFD